MPPVLYMVIPCYNEEAVLPVTSPLFLGELDQLTQAGKISEESRILFVDDGSSDSTWDIIRGLCGQDLRFRGVRLSRNRGHQNALLAGLSEAMPSCDITISIDCDGQDDIRAMEAMVDAYLDGCEIVYGVRKKRDTDTFFKRFSAESYYKLIRWMGAEVVYNHADYRLVSSRALRSFENFQEVNVFLRGMFPLVGFKSTCVYYDRAERLAGESHYPLRKMLSLAADGITSLSIRPIRLITGAGAAASLISFIGILWAIIRKFTGHTVTGWTSLMCVFFFMGSIQLLSLGVLGEYIGKIYLETKHRPRFIISERSGGQSPSLSSPDDSSGAVTGGSSSGAASGDSSSASAAGASSCAAVSGDSSGRASS